MNKILKAVTIFVLLTIILLTAIFSYLQIQKSSLVDETLVSNLTTQLDTVSIDKAINTISSGNE